MPLALADRVALVTGASSGIGRAVALHLADLGAHVAVVHLAAPEAAEAVVEEIRRLGRRAIACDTDVTRAEAVQTMAEAVESDLGAIGLLVNNVGGHVERRPLAELDEALWDRILALNLKSAYLCTRAVLPGLVACGRGAVINVSSIAAETGGPGGVVAYAAAKGGLNAFTVGLAHELAPHGIRVNAVAPGLIDTPFHAGNEPSLPRRIAAIPLGRVGQSDEVARVVGFLAGDGARYVTGQVLTVAGGR